MEEIADELLDRVTSEISEMDIEDDERDLIVEFLILKLQKVVD